MSRETTAESPSNIRRGSTMKQSRVFLQVTILGVLLVLSSSEAGAMTLDEAIERLKTHKFGQNDEALNLLYESAIGSHSDPALRQKLNEGLVAVLDSDASYDAKQFACRQLALTAAAEQIPVLARHLAEEEMNHMALYVLTHIESPEVDKALLASLEKAGGRARLGIINMLGSRRCPAAVGPLGKLAASGDEQTASAGIKALGRIGTESALAQLPDPANIPGKVDASVLGQAYLDCAAGMLDSGKPELAWKTYLSVLKSTAPSHIRAAAMKGLTQVDGQKGVVVVLDALGSPDKAMAQMLTHIAATIPGEEVTRTLAGHLGTLKPSAQAALLRALAVRGDKASLGVAMHACESQDEAVRIAGLGATGELGDASVVRFLVEHAVDSQGGELQAARKALQELRGEEVNSEIVSQLAVVGDNAKAELIAALALRNATEATAAILKAARSKSAKVRAASIQALRLLAGTDDVVGLFDLLGEAGQDDREEAAKTIIFVARRYKAVESVWGTAMSRLNDAGDAGLRASLLMLLGELGDVRALGALKSSLKDPDARIREAAVRGLSRWPSERSRGEPMDALLEIVRTSGNKVHQILALRGYINLISTAGGLSVEQKVEACRTAMTLAKELGEKRMVLAKVAEIASIEALGLARSYLGDEQLSAEAAVAMTKVGETIYPKHRKAVRDAMQEVLGAEAASSTIDKARAIIREIDAIKDYLADWEVAGPYMQEGQGCAELFDIGFGPELADAEVQWKPMGVSVLGSHPAYLDLLKELNGGEQRVAYLRTKINSEQEREVRLEIYSDDGVKAWLNGKLVHANNCMRPIPANPDTVKVTLKKGSNDLMLKVTQNNMPWGAIVVLGDIKR
jgi:HEAT repeat protein